MAEKSDTPDRLRITRRKHLALMAATPFAIAATDGVLSYPRVKVYEAAKDRDDGAVQSLGALCCGV